MKVFNPCIKEEFTEAIKEVMGLIESKEFSPYTVEEVEAMRGETKKLLKERQGA